ncbi:hypothetical protein ACFL6O_00060 [candidate division KSB1 bacterium]
MSKNIKRVLLLIPLLIIIVQGCSTDMDVRNDNEPDSRRALVTPEDIEGLISGAFREHWFAVNDQCPGNGLSVIGDEKTSSWGNWGMRDLVWEPRKAWNNSTTYRYKKFNEDPWYGNYHVISNINDALERITEGLEIGDPGSTDTQRAVTFGNFCKGLAYGYIGLFFDRGVLLPESMDLDNYDPQFFRYDDLINSGIWYLNECIRLCEDHDFTLPATWINGVTITNDDMKKLCHSFMARYMVLKARNNAERDAADWNSVLSHIDNGITEDFAPEGDNDLWWHPVQHSSNWTGWSTASNRLIGPSDTSSNYQKWIYLPVNNRNHLIIYSCDRRITGDLTGITDGKWFSYSRAFGSPLYFLYNSSYRFTKFGYQYPEAYGPMPHLTMTEMDMLRAEAYLRGYGGGTRDGIAELINKTRVPSGEMEPLHGNESDLELWKWMCYEKRIETQMTGISYFDYRGWSDLRIRGEKVVHMPAGTPVHFPVPGKELELLMVDNYTFGGVGQPDTTPSLYKTAKVIDMEYIIAARDRINRNNKSENTIPPKK